MFVVTVSWIPMRFWGSRTKPKLSRPTSAAGARIECYGGPSVTLPAVEHRELPDDPPQHKKDAAIEK